MFARSSSNLQTWRVKLLTTQQTLNWLQHVVSCGRYTLCCWNMRIFFLFLFTFHQLRKTPFCFFCYLNIWTHLVCEREWNKSTCIGLNAIQDRQGSFQFQYHWLVEAWCYCFTWASKHLEHRNVPICRILRKPSPPVFFFCYDITQPQMITLFSWFMLAGGTGLFDC